MWEDPLHCGKYLLTAVHIKRYSRRKVSCLLCIWPSLFCQVEFVLLLWLQLIPLLMPEIVFLDFHSGLWTNHILWTFQVFSTRPGLLRHPALWMELLLACYPPQWEVRGGHCWRYSHSCRRVPHILEMTGL